MTQTKQELVVGYQGTEGAYSQLAAMHHFAGAEQAIRCVGLKDTPVTFGA